MNAYEKIVVLIGAISVTAGMYQLMKHKKDNAAFLLLLASIAVVALY